jgi:hypothetical protein
VGVCPTQAIEAVKVGDDAMARRAQAETLRTLEPALGAKPRVYYRNLHRADHCFVAGSVTTLMGGRVECVEGAQVTLLQAGATVASASTDAFGDFKFDALPRQSGSYLVQVSHSIYGAAACPVGIEMESVVLDGIKLTANGT